MDRNSVAEAADVLSTYSFKIDTLISLLVEKNVFSKEEFNKELIKVMDTAEMSDETDDYIIEELKKKVLLK